MAKKITLTVDPENHAPEFWEHVDALLDVLGAHYQDTFLSQARRPEGMKYFDFVMSEVHGLRI